MGPPPVGVVWCCGCGVCGVVLWCSRRAPEVVVVAAVVVVVASEGSEVGAAAAFAVVVAILAQDFLERRGEALASVLYTFSYATLSAPHRLSLTP